MIQYSFCDKEKLLHKAVCHKWKMKLVRIKERRWPPQALYNFPLWVKDWDCRYKLLTCTRPPFTCIVCNF